MIRIYKRQTVEAAVGVGLGEDAAPCIRQYRRDIHWSYRGTSLMRTLHPPRITIRTTAGSYWGAVSRQYRRDTAWSYRDTSLIRNTPPPRITICT